MAYADPSTILGFKGIEIPDQQGMLLKALQINAARGQGRLQDLQIDKEQQSNDQISALMRAIRDPAFASLDPQAQRSRVMQAAPIAGQSYLKSLLDTQKQQGEIDTSTTNLALKRREAVDQAVGSLTAMGTNVTHQDVLSTVQRLVSGKILSASEAQSDLADMPTDPSELPVWLAKSQRRGLKPNQQLEQNNPTLMATDNGIAAVRKDGSGGSMVPNITGVATNPNGTPGIGPGFGAPQASQSINQPYVGQQPAGNFTGDPASLYALVQRIRDPMARAQATRALQNQLAGANPSPDASGVFQGSGAAGPVPLMGSQQGAPGALGAKREEISYHNDPMTGQVMQLPRYAQPGQSIAPGVVPSAGGGNGGNGSVAGLTEAALNDAATRLAHGDQTVLQNYGRGMQGGAQLIAIRNRAAEIARGEGRSADDQTASGVTLGGERAGARTAATRSANLSIAAHELDKFSDLALSASSSVPRTQFVPLNRLSQIVSSGTGSVEQAAFNAANESVINAFAQVAGRGTPTVAGMEHARKMLSTVQTQEQYAAVVKQLKAEAAAALASTAETQSQQRGRITGKSPASSVDASGWGIEKVN